MAKSANDAIQEYRAASKERKDAQTRLDALKEEYQTMVKYVDELGTILGKKREQLIKAVEHTEPVYQD